MSELVSVLIPAFNHEKYIQEAIISVINQSYENIELIVIDDGSADSTWNKIQELKLECEKRFVRVVFQTQENMGTAITNRRMIDISQGDFLYFLASDDALEKEAVECQMRFLFENQDYICVYGDNNIIDSDSRICWMDEKKLPENKKSFFSFKTYCDYATTARMLNFGKSIKGREDYRKLNNVEYSDIIIAGHYIPIGGLIKKKCLEKIIPFNVNTPLEDSYLNCQLMKIGKIKVLDTPTYRYRISASNRANKKKVMSLLNDVTWYYEMYLLDTKYPNYKDTLKNAMPYLKNMQMIWEISKNSIYWDENFYRKQYPEIVKAGFVPLVHYLTYGIQAGGKKYIPSKYFDNFFRRPVEMENPLLPQPKYRRTFPYLFFRKMYRISIKPILRKIIAYKNKNLNLDIGDFV